MANIANYMGLLICCVAFALLTFIKGKEEWQFINLIVGVLLIAIAALFFGMFTEMNDEFYLLIQTKKIDESTHKDVITIVGIWAFVLPTVVAAIGANLITAWFRPKKH